MGFTQEPSVGDASGDASCPSWGRVKQALDRVVFPENSGGNKEQDPREP